MQSSRKLRQRHSKIYMMIPQAARVLEDEDNLVFPPGFIILSHISHCSYMQIPLSDPNMFHSSIMLVKLRSFGGSKSTPSEALFDHIMTLYY